MTSGTLAHALAYAGLGWAVLPLQPGQKVPLNGQGLHHATRDERVIEGWFTACPQAGIGVALETSGLVAVDIDPRNGGDLELRDRLPPTLTAATGGGGLHLVYRAPRGARLRGTLGPGIDVKHRGYVAVEPSRHPSGKAYNWIDFEPLEGELPDIADAPAELLLPATAAPSLSVDGGATIGEGGRNSALAAIAGRLRRDGLSADAERARRERGAR